MKDHIDSQPSAANISALRSSIGQGGVYDAGQQSVGLRAEAAVFMQKSHIEVQVVVSQDSAQEHRSCPAHKCCWLNLYLNSLLSPAES